jgi:N-acetylglucosaminyl-diphospho-decaprenol L-rhamnosyltransferase
MDRKLTIILVSYFSFNHLKRVTKQLKKYKFIIIENSQEKLVKNYFKKKKNIKVIFPKKNLGYGQGNNLGISHAKTDYCLILNPDTAFKEKNIQSIFYYIKKIDDFGILLPRLKNKKSVKIFHKKKYDFIKVNYKCIGQDLASGCCMLINKKKLNKTSIFDKKIFLYKEETDLIKRCSENNINTFLLKNSEVIHFGSKSYQKKIASEFEIFRNWHWMWSNFYFYKKHFGFNYALIKFSKKLISSFLKKEIFFLFKNTKYKIYQARFNGLWNSIKNNPSNYRMNI